MSGEGPARRIAVPLPVLAGLGVVLVISLLATAWLLGRESGRRLVRDPGPPPPEVARVAPAPATTSRSPSPTPPRLAPAATPLPAVTAPPPAPQAARPTPRPPPAPAQSTEAVAVARYFRELEALSSAKYWDDPEALAMSLVQEMAGGGTSGVERLQRVHAELEAAVRAMSVPEPCREHHRRSLELSASAGRLLQSIAAGAAAGDLSGLMSATAEAEQLQAGADQLRELENRLRARYGLPPAPS